MSRVATPTPSSALSTEYEVKAAFLYKFVMFTEWPKKAFADAKAPIVVQVIGKDPFSGRLAKTFKGKKQRGRSFVVRHSLHVPETTAAHVVFAGGMSEENRAKLVALTKKKPVLLVGDTKGFAEEGAIVNLYLEKEKVRFEINANAAKAVKLKLSSQLLKLAKIVKTKKERGRQ